MKNFLKIHSRKIVAAMMVMLCLYGAGRLYFELTAGFTEGNITTDLAQEPDHAIQDLPFEKFSEVQKILRQPFHYLGKGCQSYVFKSADGEYVIKFLKYQRFRPQIYLEGLSFIPQVDAIRAKKAKVKREKLDALLTSWKVSYEHLRQETGLVYLHLNQTHSFAAPLVIYDKMGMRHELNPDNFAFLVQKSATMLCKSIHEQMAKGDVDEAKTMIHHLVSILLSEYQRGLGDQDHALMQNTGVIDGIPIHIDVGQFAKDPRFQEPDVYKSELFSKTYKFRIWLSKNYPELEVYLASLLTDIIGPEMNSLRPQFKTIDEGA